MKTILITGATAGIGRHAALELVRQGHHVIATGRRLEALNALAAEVRAIEANAAGSNSAAGRGRAASSSSGRVAVAMGRLDVLRLDVTSEGEVVDALRHVERLTGGRGIDVLVNNAGYGQMGPVESVSDEDLRRQFDTNVFGLMAVTRAFVPQMRARGEGRIVNVGSIGGRVTFPLMGAYNATKYAVESLSDALRNELALFGIRVSLIEPGPILTEFNDRAMETVDTTGAGAASSPYAPLLADADKFRRQFEAAGSGPEVVTRAIVHAALSRRPRIRYVVPGRAAAFLAVIRLLPTRWVDALMRAASGFTRAKLLGAGADAGA